MEVWHRDRCFMEEGYRGKIWEYLGWLVHEKGDKCVYGVSLWNFIRSGWLNFSELLQYEVGDGTRVKFLKHVWCGDCTLKEDFLELHYLSRARDASVAEVMGWSGGRIHWDVRFHRPS